MGTGIESSLCGDLVFFEVIREVLDSLRASFSEVVVVACTGVYQDLLRFSSGQ